MTKLIPHRASLSVFLAALAGCASRGTLQQATIDRGYPSKGALADVLKAPLPPREEALHRGRSVEEWELAGSFPDKASSLPFRGDDPLARAVTERLAQQKKSVVLTESMQCYAREMGRFVAHYGQLPEDDLQAFAAGRCGVLPIAPSFLYSIPSAALPTDAALAFFEQATTKLAAASELGVWMGREAGRHVVLAASGVPKVRLASVDSPAEGDDVVRVRGTLLEPAAWLRAYTGEGSLGFHGCEPTRHTLSLLPDFDVTCKVAGEDPYAVLDMLAAAPQALLGRQVLMLVIPTGHPAPSTFRRLPLHGLPARGGPLEQFNAVRASSGASLCATFRARARPRTRSFRTTSLRRPTRTRPASTSSPSA
ncbi:MAG TPA: hypothetical protein VK550_10765 [Polyangiaceae bacterium]|nr:hypothetical protein [Polyangiaceae bacterium]